jgi:small subunit ribosomal protein S4e
MGRGPKKHLKRLNAPKHWMLDKMGGQWAPKPSAGPHKARECLPLVCILRNRLKLALTRREVVQVLMQRMCQVDGRVRTDPKYPAGFMDIVTLGQPEKCFDKQAAHRYRVVYDIKGRFKLQKITDAANSKFKVCSIKKQAKTKKGVPYVVTHDGRTIRYPSPALRVRDSIQLNIETGEVAQIVKFDVGCMVTVIKGKNCGRVGTYTHVDKHPGSFDIIHAIDAAGQEFVTRKEYIFVIGEGGAPLYKLPKRQGVKLSILQASQVRKQMKEKSKK